MLFNSFTYLLFLPIVFVLHWLLPRSWRKYLLLVASYLFYMNWIPVYLVLILALTIANYFFGLAIDKFTTKRKLVFGLGIVFNLACLFYYKYTNFVVEQFFAAINSMNIGLKLNLAMPTEAPVFNILLPLGISFFTFEFVHYLTDIYRGDKPIRNVFDFALFAAFFPTQIAGPIKRYQDFRAQLANVSVFKWQYLADGSFLIFQGLFKKIVIGDNLAPIVQYAYTHVPLLNGFDAWLSAFLFAIQIYCDFSGYTDIGIGSAMLFGYKVPINFNWPYFASSITEFWKRWHISLSSWLKDYVYISLGGSRQGSIRGSINLLLTFLICGIWHGAAWTYIFFGMYHGIGLVVHKHWSEFVSKVEFLSKLRPTMAWHLSGWAITFTFYLLTVITFCSANLSIAWQVYSKLLSVGGKSVLTPMVLESTVIYSGLLYSMFLLLRMPQFYNYLFFGDQLAKLGQKLEAWWNDSFVVQSTVYVCASIIILGFAPSHVTPFVYFQF